MLVEGFTHQPSQTRVPLHLALNATDEVLGLPVLHGPEAEENKDENVVPIASPTQAAQNDQALAELRSMMSGVSRA